LVLTINERASGPYDPATLSEIPKGVPVYRALFAEPEKAMVQGVKKLLGRNTKGSLPRGEEAPQALGTSSDSGFEAALKRAKRTYDRFLVRNVLIPDDLVLWTLPAVMLGRTICARHHVDLIFTTAPPFTDLLVGRLLQKVTALPWVADYRDLWTGDVLRDWVPRWRRRIETSLERWALATVNAVIAVSEPKSEFLRQRLSQVEPGRFWTITNGYDLDEYEGLARTMRTNGQIRFVYTGRLFKNRRGYEVLEAAGSLFRARPELKPKLRIEYYGGVSPEIRNHLDQLIVKLELGQAVRFFPDVPYADAKQLQIDADVLFLIVDTGETTSGVIPGKLFEYVAARRPILCIAESGATSAIIREGRLGWVTAPGDVSTLQNVLEDILSASAPPSLNPNPNYLQQFERRQLVGRMAQIFEDVLASRCDLRHRSEQSLRAL
jgi:glycosyltransferase involved in cell wall biosynthesis